MPDFIYKLDVSPLLCKHGVSHTREIFTSRHRFLRYLGLLLFGLLTDLNQPACAISKGLSVPEDDPIRQMTVSLYGDHDDCTGVKIAPNLILTARHCRLDKSTRAIFPDGSSYKIVQRLVPNAKRTSRKNEYDFVILIIAANVPGPVALIADEAPGNGSIAWIAGYGGKKLTRTANPLRKLPVEMIDRDYSPSAATVRTLKGGAVCDGDSGGPGYTQARGQIVVWGIDSAPLGGGPGCSSRELYANVTSERDWIRKTIAGSY
ncbi:MAG TPA: S1 family peptidase [Bradyrhizobium sp.]|uniref:S1 family peptidase n=1 Tax=Bradyrhizobium sp. TaxID=376 RepID=UPI002B675093|nr:S1 family peptidase [Bradyrhizobium sp.]HLZ01105.1 S1 family peptidase [Bradyrhizobium sp.]